MDSIELSLIIPAYNESRCIAGTLQAARKALETSDCSSYEIVVADDASTDDTAMIAEGLGARVVFSGKRNIGATRNVGAGAAHGEILLFLDADTLITTANIDEVLEAIHQGAIGGGAPVEWISPVSSFFKCCAKVWNFYSRLTKSPAGSFFFALREAFEKVEGFDEEFFVSEEIHLGRKLKREGRLVITSTPIRTSPRKGKDFSKREHFHLFLHLLVSPRKTRMERTHLDIWYTRKGEKSGPTAKPDEEPHKT